MATTKTVRRCVDCVAAGITTNRKTPHPGPRCASHHRVKRFDRRNYSHGTHIMVTYGISTEEYESIKSHQNGKCAICQRATGAKKKLSVDHCHKTGVVRGLLCQVCNKHVLGYLRDDPEALRRAARYLEHPPAVAVIGVRITPDMTLNEEL